MKRRKIAYGVLVFILLVILYVVFFPRISVLSISNKKNPKQKIYSTQAYEAGFCISYTHSVNKGRVHDYYECDKANGDLILTNSHFVSYGAGMPELEETDGASFVLLENGYLMKNINRRVPKLVMAVGVIANHTFSPCYFGGELLGEPLSEIPFTDFFEPQTSLIFECKKINYIDFMLYGLKRD